MYIVGDKLNSELLLSLTLFALLLTWGSSFSRLSSLARYLSGCRWISQDVIYVPQSELCRRDAIASIGTRQKVLWENHFSCNSPETTTDNDDDNTRDLLGRFVITALHSEEKLNKRRVASFKLATFPCPASQCCKSFLHLVPIQVADFERTWQRWLRDRAGSLILASCNKL